DIGEARLTIDEVLAGASGPIGSLTPPVPAPGVRRQPMLPWALAVLFALVALVLFVRTPARTEVRPLHVEITLPADVEYFSGPSLSADGTRIALVGVRVGTRQVYLRSLDDTDMRPVAGTDTATTVVLAPDGSAAAFVTN